MTCRVCDDKTTQFFSLGDMPLVNSFLTKNQISKEKKYDLSLSFCPSCYLVQLTKTVSPEELFRNYIYFSSTSSKFLAHCKETADYITQRFHLTSSSLVLELASNDGAQLQYFKELNIPILGIDPAKNIAQVANEKGIKTIPDFFGLKLAKKLATKDHIHANIIFGANVLAHVPEIVDFVQGVRLVLDPKGTAIFEFPYLSGLFENKFDTIYHEHVFYYSLLAVENLFQKAGLQIYDADMTEMQGGSLRIFASHPYVYPMTKRLIALRARERTLGFHRLSSYLKIKTKVEKLRKDIKNLLTDLTEKHASIAAYSAPAKGNILLNYFGISKDFLDFIVDKAPAKQGLYTPGTHLFVYPPSKIYEQNPDYLLILCWNIADEVMSEYHKYHTNGGKFIIPIPKLSII